MKNFLSLLFMLFLGVAFGFSQDYNIRIENQGERGKYYVNVTTVLDKKQNTQSLDYLKKLAVDGVMFRGVAGANGYSSQKPLIEDPTVKISNKEFFDAFNHDKLYLNYVTLESESVSVTQLPKKKYEVSGRLLVDKEGLLHFLEDAGIVKGFSNLW